MRLPGPGSRRRHGSADRNNTGVPHRSGAAAGGQGAGLLFRREGRISGTESVVSPVSAEGHRAGCFVNIWVQAYAEPQPPLSRTYSSLTRSAEKVPGTRHISGHLIGVSNTVWAKRSTGRYPILADTLLRHPEPYRQQCNRPRGQRGNPVSRSAGRYKEWQLSRKTGQQYRETCRGSFRIYQNMLRPLRCSP